MKSKSTLAAFVAAILALVFSTSSAVAQTAPYYDTVGNVSPTMPVTQSWLASWQARSNVIAVPPERASEFTGIDTGFTVLASIGEQSVALNQVVITRCRFSLYHLDALTGIETPVKLPSGADAVNIGIQLFTTEAGTSRPNVFTAGSVSGAVNSNTNAPVIGTATQNVGAIFLTRHRFNWGQVPNFVPPTLNKGYVIRYELRFIATHNGVTYPETVIDPETTKFTYVVKELKVPSLVGMSVPPNGGQGSVTFQGEGIEWWELETSTDLLSWGVIPTSGPGSSYLGSNSYQWMFMDNPQSTRRFFRLRWRTGPAYMKVEPST